MKSKVKRKKIFCLENNVSFIWSKLFCQCNYWSIELVAVAIIFVIITIWSILKNLPFTFHRIAFCLLLIFFSHLFIRLASACLTKKTVCLSDKQKRWKAAVCLALPISFLANFNSSYEILLFNSYFFRLDKHAKL